MCNSRDGGSEEGEAEHQPAEPGGGEGPISAVTEPRQTQHPEHPEQDQERLQKQEPGLRQQRVI